MCLAIPVRVTELLPDNMAMTEVGGVCRPVSLTLLDDVQVGDYLVVHVGFALSRLDPEEAQKTLELFASMGVPVFDAREET